MKRLLCGIGICLVVLALSSLTAVAGEKVDEVRIGIVVPLSGIGATVGTQMKTGATIAIEEINAKGGIKALGGAKLRLIAGDSQGKPDVGASETERLIQRENVHVMIGSYQSATTIVTTEVAERYKTPWVVLASVSDRITGRGFKYVFRPCNMAAYDANEQLQAIKHLTQEFGKGPKTYGLLVEGTEWGKSHAENVRRIAKEIGYDLVLDEAYPPGQADFSPQILKIRSKRPDFLIMAMYTPDHILFNKQQMEQRLDLAFGLHSVGSGAEDPAFYKALPVQAVEYMFVQEDFQIDITDVAPWTQAIDKKTREMLGYELNAYVAQGYSNAYIIADALERAGSADKDKIRDALAKTNITSGPALITGYQKIAFDATGQNVDSHGVISENLKGKRTTVWPVANRPKEIKPVWPIPAWKDR